MKQGIKGAAEALFHPIIGYFGPRFDNIHARLDKIAHHAADLDKRVSEIHTEVQSVVRRLDDFERHISTDIQTSVEVLLTHQRSTAILQERISELQELVQRLGSSKTLAGETDASPDEQAAAVDEGPLNFSRASS